MDCSTQHPTACSKCGGLPVEDHYLDPSTGYWLPEYRCIQCGWRSATALELNRAAMEDGSAFRMLNRSKFSASHEALRMKVKG
jgi:hypothetical protein